MGGSFQTSHRRTYETSRLSSFSCSLSVVLMQGALAEIVTQLHVAVIVSVTLVSQSWSWAADDVRAAELHVCGCMDNLAWWHNALREYFFGHVDQFSSSLMYQNCSCYSFSRMFFEFAAKCSISRIGKKYIFCTIEHETVKCSGCLTFLNLSFSSTSCPDA